MITIDAPPGIYCYERELLEIVCVKSAEVEPQLRPSFIGGMLFDNETGCALSFNITTGDATTSVYPGTARMPQEAMIRIHVIKTNPACNQRPMS